MSRIIHGLSDKSTAVFDIGAGKVAIISVIDDGLRFSTGRLEIICEPENVVSIPYSIMDDDSGFLPMAELLYQRLRSTKLRRVHMEGTDE